MKKRMISLVLALAMCLSLCTTVFAEDATHEITEENYTQVGQFTFDNPIIRCIQLGEIAKPGTEEDTVNGGQFGGVYYRKTDVGSGYEYSDPKRVSDDMVCTIAGGRISTNRTETISAKVSGAYEGLGFEISKSVTSELGYSFDVPKGVTAHIEYRAFLAVEFGVREKVSNMTGKVLARENYRVEIPQRGEYFLVTS